MFKVYISLIFPFFILSCSTPKTVVKMNDGFYIGKFNQGLLSDYTVLINVKDSTAILDAYVDEKGMVTSFNIFDNKQMLPGSEWFYFYKDGDGYTLSNTFNNVAIVIEKGSFVIEKPLKLKLKYYKENPIDLYPSKKYALYCYCWFYPHVILGEEDELDAPCKVYIQNKMELILKNIDQNLSYMDYFTIVKDSIMQYKIDFENALEK